MRIRRKLNVVAKSHGLLTYKLAFCGLGLSAFNLLVHF